MQLRILMVYVLMFWGPCTPHCPCTKAWVTGFQGARSNLNPEALDLYELLEDRKHSHGMCGFETRMEILPSELPDLVEIWVLSVLSREPNAGCACC